MKMSAANDSKPAVPSTDIPNKLDVALTLSETVKTQDKSDADSKYDLMPINLPDSYKFIYKTYLKKVEELAVPILDSITEEQIQLFEFYHTRYFENRYSINFGTECKEKGYNDILVRVHTNKLLLIALASGNDIVSSDQEIVEINFVVNKSDRSKIKLKGKLKRGAKHLERHTILCQVTLKGEPKPYNIRAGVSGYLIEMNELIKSNPSLLKTDPKGLGFLAIVMPKGPRTATEKSVDDLDLMTDEEYRKYLVNRPLTKSDFS